MHSEIKGADAAEDARYGKDWRGSSGRLRGKRERLARLQEAKEHLELAAAPSVWRRSRSWPSGRKGGGKKKLGRKAANPGAAVDHDRKVNPTALRARS